MTRYKISVQFLLYSMIRACYGRNIQSFKVGIISGHWNTVVAAAILHIEYSILRRTLLILVLICIDCR